MTTTATTVCPECGNATPAIDGSKRWCDQCNWNVEPYSRDDDNFFARQYARIGKRSGTHTLHKLVTAPVESLRPRLTISKATAYCLATVIHASSLMTFVGGAYLVVGFFPSIPAIMLGLALCGLAWLLLPALGKVPEDVVPQSDFPALYAFVNDVARDLGGRPIQHIIVDEAYNAAYSTVGWRREAVLWIGLPLWIALTPQERVAILGHEVAHGVNGDSTRGAIIGSAVDTLDSWIALLRAEQDTLSRIGTWLLSVPVSALQIALAHLLWRGSQKAEFLADYLGATISGTPAAMNVLVKLSLSEHFHDFLMLRIYSTSQSGQDLFDQFRRQIASIPAGKWNGCAGPPASKVLGSTVRIRRPPNALRFCWLTSWTSRVSSQIRSSWILSMRNSAPGRAAGEPPHRQVRHGLISGELLLDLFRWLRALAWKMPAIPCEHQHKGCQRQNQHGDPPFAPPSRVPSRLPIRRLLCHRPLQWPLDATKTAIERCQFLMPPVTPPAIHKCQECCGATLPRPQRGTTCWQAR
ncbi:MAG: M48 family metalloprotease [Sphingomonadales bacterium]|nr:M48 family metalloprotease [Sphingomonadales bacterium]